MSETVKLQKYIADSGLMSRRAAEREIEAGNVTVNGVTARLGDRVSPGEVTVAVGGHDIVNACGEYIYIMLNKPAGVVTTMKDEKGKNRRTVAELVADVHVRVYPVGRHILSRYLAHERRRSRERALPPVRKQEKSLPRHSPRQCERRKALPPLLSHDDNRG